MIKVMITFYTTADALETEEIMRSAAVSGRLVPIPPSLSASCGLAWAMPPEDYNNIPDEVSSRLPEPEGIVRIDI